MEWIGKASVILNDNISGCGERNINMSNSVKKRKRVDGEEKKDESVDEGIVEAGENIPEPTDGSNESTFSGGKYKKQEKKLKKAKK